MGGQFIFTLQNQQLRPPQGRVVYHVKNLHERFVARGSVHYLHLLNCIASSRTSISFACSSPAANIMSSSGGQTRFSNKSEGKKGQGTRPRIPPTPLDVDNINAGGKKGSSSAGAGGRTRSPQKTVAKTPRQDAAAQQAAKARANEAAAAQLAAAQQWAQSAAAWAGWNPQDVGAWGPPPAVYPAAPPPTVQYPPAAYDEHGNPLYYAPPPSHSPVIQTYPAEYWPPAQPQGPPPPSAASASSSAYPLYPAPAGPAAAHTPAVFYPAGGAAVSPAGGYNQQSVGGYPYQGTLSPAAGSWSPTKGGTAGGPRGRSSSPSKGAGPPTVVHHHPPRSTMHNVGKPTDPGCRTLLIAYFPWEATEQSITTIFAQYVRVVRVHLVLDRVGYFFAEYGGRGRAKREGEGAAVSIIRSGVIFKEIRRISVRRVSRRLERHGQSFSGRN